MAAPVRPPGGALLEIDGLTLRRRSAVVLDRVSLSLDPGHIVALMGANGSGKTTLMKTVAGVLADYEGRVAIGGSAPGARTKGIVSYLPDAPFLDPATTPERAVGMYSHFFADFDRAKAGELVERFGLVEHQPVREMSKGMREKLHIALVMSRRARLFLLDEPLSGVDPVARRVVLEEIVRDFAPDALMLIATHLSGRVARRRVLRHAAPAVRGGHDRAPPRDHPLPLRLLAHRLPLARLLHDDPMASCLRLSIGFAAAAAVGALILAVSGLAQANPLADLFSPALPYYWTLDPVRALVLTSIEVVADLCIPVQLVCLVTIGCSSRWRYLGSKVPVIATVAWFAAYTSLGALAERLAALGLDDEGALEPNFFFNNIFVSRQIDFTQVFVPLGTNLSVIGFTAVLLWWAVRAIERHTSLL